MPLAVGVGGGSLGVTAELTGVGGGEIESGGEELALVDELVIVVQLYLFPTRARFFRKLGVGSFDKRGLGRVGEC